MLLRDQKVLTATEQLMSRAKQDRGMTNMQRWASGLVGALALAACLGGVGWQIENGMRLSFLFVSAVFAILCIHWLLEELHLVQA